MANPAAPPALSTTRRHRPSRRLEGHQPGANIMRAIEQTSLAAGSSTQPALAARLRRALGRVVATTSAPAPAVARLALAAIIFPHGAQHALGWFGGYGFAG